MGMRTGRNSNNKKETIPTMQRQKNKWLFFAPPKKKTGRKFDICQEQRMNTAQTQCEEQRMNIHDY